MRQSVSEQLKEPPYHDFSLFRGGGFSGKSLRIEKEWRRTERFWKTDFLKRGKKPTAWLFRGWIVVSSHWSGYELGSVFLLLFFIVSFKGKRKHWRVRKIFLKQTCSSPQLVSHHGPPRVLHGNPRCALGFGHIAGWIPKKLTGNWMSWTTTKWQSTIQWTRLWQMVTRESCGFRKRDNNDGIRKIDLAKQSWGLAKSKSWSATFA